MAKKRSRRRSTSKKAATDSSPLRIFISYSHQDSETVHEIADRLTDEGHRIWIDQLKLVPGDNISERIADGIEQADVIILAVSSASLASSWVQREFSTIVLQQISQADQRVIPIRLDKCEFPSYLADRFYIDFSRDFERALNQLTETLTADSKEAATKRLPKATMQHSRDALLDRLRESLRRGQLTLFCGAGISVDAGIPTWNDLLHHLLRAMLDRISQNRQVDLGSRAAAEFQRRNGTSSLILGKYLKNNLGRDFSTEVRNALYSNGVQDSALIDSIVDLSRPQRDSKPLDSIVSFNFDSLIEENLDTARVPNKAIFSESISHDPNEMPIYHVHGYLPQNADVPPDSELIFSEDAYHSQFIDAFSWSNLIQLNKLTQNTCLFVGISLTDPNMRRLLDVAWRKNPDKRMQHYIVKKLPHSADGTDVLDDVSRLLEEQDANALGLNVVWIEEYDELPTIISSIAGRLPGTTEAAAAPNVQPDTASS